MQDQELDNLFQLLESSDKTNFDLGLTLIEQNPDWQAAVEDRYGFLLEVFDKAEFEDLFSILAAFRPDPDPIYLRIFYCIEILYFFDPKYKNKPLRNKLLNQIHQTGIDYRKHINKFINAEELEDSSFFNFRELKKFPKNLHLLPNLKSLELWHCQIEQIPSNLSELKTLESLNLIDNQIKKVPVEIWSHQTLERLSLDHNPIIDFPKNPSSQIPPLESLTLSSVKNPTIIDNILGFKNLKNLDFFNSKLETLPKDIGQLTDLKNLNLSKNLLSSLPDTFSKLTKLQNLNLSKNRFKKLPKKIYQLKQLKVLDLGHNKGIQISEEIGYLVNLEGLVLEHCELTKKDIPKIIFMLPKLKDIWMNGNQIPKNIRDLVVYDCTIHFEYDTLPF